MRTTIDKAGRLVIPKALREQLGLGAGEVELAADGRALRIEAVVADGLETDGQFLVIPASGSQRSDDDIREMRLADQRRTQDGAR